MMNPQVDKSHYQPNNNANQQSFVRKRTRATAEQLAILEETFAVNVSPNSKLRKQLAEKLKMNERSIQIWFQNRRAKVKHMQKRAHIQMHQAAMRAQFYDHHFNGSNDPFKSAYFPPPYMMNYNPTGHIFPPPLSRSISVPIPEPPMYYNTSASPPQDVFNTTPNQQHSPVLFSTLLGSPSELYKQQMLEKDLLALDHGPISPSPTPMKDDPFYQEKKQVSFDECSSSDLFSNEEHQSLVHEPPPTLFSESDIWISTPDDVESYSDSPTTIPCYFHTEEKQQEELLTATTLTIGTWQRMNYPGSDLTCCYIDNTFIWYIEESGHQFKIKIPVHHVTKINFNVDDVYLYLSRPPLFYMKSPEQQWVQCSDFTENKQASHYLCHVLKGQQLQKDFIHLILVYPHLSYMKQ